ncbi:MAG: DUF4468 domain-containing protein [Bacteroidetes bacterium]|nr:DUF4468 domain-containing protein [Bacteroidota bacterium]
MRALFTIAFGIVCLSASAQLLSYPIGQDSLIDIERVIKLPDSTRSKDDLYNEARSWVSKTYPNSIQVLQLEDKASGHLICNGKEFVLSGFNGGTYLSYTLEIWVKQGRYKYKVYNLDLSGENYGPLNDWFWAYNHDKFNKKILESKKEAKKRYELLLNGCYMKLAPIVTSLRNAMASDIKPDNF